MSIESWRAKLAERMRTPEAHETSSDLRKSLLDCESRIAALVTALVRVTDAAKSYRSDILGLSADGPNDPRFAKYNHAPKWCGRDESIAIAEAALAALSNPSTGATQEANNCGRRIAEAIAAEREACAAIAKRCRDDWSTVATEKNLRLAGIAVADEIAAAIRARGETKP